jgi:hypothetical protein
MKRKGVIYILPDLAFLQCVKIGYAHNLRNRQMQLNDTLRFSNAIYEVESDSL